MVYQNIKTKPTRVRKNPLPFLSKFSHSSSSSIHTIMKIAFMYDYYCYLIWLRELKGTALCIGGGDGGKNVCWICDDDHQQVIVPTNL